MAGPATGTAAKEQSYVYRTSRDGKQLPTNFHTSHYVPSELSLNDNEVHVNRIDKNGVSDQLSQLAARRDLIPKVLT